MKYEAMNTERRFTQLRPLIRKASNQKNLPFQVIFETEGKAGYVRRTLYEFWKRARDMGVPMETSPVFAVKGNVLTVKEKSKINFTFL